jgi:hypothetical protein
VDNFLPMRHGEVANIPPDLQIACVRTAVRALLDSRCELSLDVCESEELTPSHAWQLRFKKLYLYTVMHAAI